MAVRVRSIAAKAAVLIFVGIVLPAVYAHWLETRTIAALDMPFSLTALVFGALGLLVFFLTRQIMRHGLAKERAAPSENGNHGYYPFRRRLPLAARFVTLPSFGLVYTVVLSSVLIPTLLIFIYTWGYDHSSVGIRVQLLKSSPLKAFGDSSPSPLVIRVEN